jgi:hypothetical protein
MSDLIPSSPAPGGEFLLYQTEDGRTRLQVRVQDETVWLSLNQMAELFQRDKSVISRHINNVFDEGELVRERVVANYATTAADGKTYQVEFFNLDVIISVGYRVKSPRGTQFRIWATQRLRDYIVKGFTRDDERLKQHGGGNYFEELLARIRDMRSSGKEFWRKGRFTRRALITIRARRRRGSSSPRCRTRCTWAAHGQTAAEVIHARVDASKPQAGMANWVGAKPSKAEAVIAKNYLSPEELNALNRIVVAYLELAEVRALNRQPMYMRDWLAKLDDFLRLGVRDILKHAGKISHEQAARKAELEFEKFHRAQLAEPSQVEKDFDEAIKNLPAPKPVKPARKKK